MAKKGGQNKVWCKKYKDQGRQEVSKARRLLRHLFNCEDAVDKSALAAIVKLDKSVIDKARRQMAGGARLWQLPA